MPTTTTEVHPRSHLYQLDETAWLEEMALLAAVGRGREIDFANLSEYLTDMARRDRREIFSRLVVLLVHLLKWDYQPEQRASSWRATIREQRREFGQLLDSGTLLNHAENVFLDAYREAREQAADETAQAVALYPSFCPWTFDAVLDEIGHE